MKYIKKFENQNIEDKYYYLTFSGEMNEFFQNPEVLKRTVINFSKVFSSIILEIYYGKFLSVYDGYIFTFKDVQDLPIKYKNRAKHLDPIQWKISLWTDYIEIPNNDIELFLATKKYNL